MITQLYKLVQEQRHFQPVNDDILKGTKPWLYQIPWNSAPDMNVADPGTRAV